MESDYLALFKVLIWCEWTEVSKNSVAFEEFSNGVSFEIMLAKKIFRFSHMRSLPLNDRFDVLLL